MGKIILWSFFFLPLLLFYNFISGPFYYVRNELEIDQWPIGNRLQAELSVLSIIEVLAQSTLSILSK